MRVVLLILVLLIAQIGTARPAFAQSPGMRALQTNPFLGSVPSGTATADTLALSIGDAIDGALQHNLGVLLGQQAADQARGARWVALSQLLPGVSGRLAETHQKVNLAAFGFPLPPGVPSLVGPFSVFDVRLRLSQSVLDMSAFNEARAKAHDVVAARYSYQSARDLVVLVAANMYLQALAASARVESARAQTATARVLHNQAVDLKQNGLVAGIDVLRAEVELNTQRQRATAAQNDFEKAKLQLARVIGLPAGQAFALSDPVPYSPFPEMTVEQALDRAVKGRPDYQAALARVRAAEASRASVVASKLPSVRVAAEYGDIGLKPSDARAVFAVVGALDVPIFQGGRTRGRLLEADAQLRARRAEAEDLRAAIDYDVRTAFLDLQAASQQLDVATQTRDLAAAQLVQARDRFAAGVASNIEVTQAQEAVTLAGEQYIGALYSYNVSKAELARSVGAAEESVRQYLGGSR